jgi:hypothetical protein
VMGPLLTKVCEGQESLPPIQTQEETSVGRRKEPLRLALRLLALTRETTSETPATRDE